MTVSGGNLSFTSFAVDTIAGTAAGNFAQEGGTLAFTGTTTDTDTTFNPTGRLGAIDGIPGFVGVKWDYASFTTGASTNNNGTVNGTAVTNVGDVNGDGIDDYTATFVSAGQMGPEWGCCEGIQYIEVWDVSIVSVVPIPAALWLFGSGLIWLFASAFRSRRKESQ